MIYKNCLLLLILYIIAVSVNGSGNVYYSVKENDKTVVYNQELREDLVNNWLAVASFQKSLNSTGWDILYIKSNPKLSDDQQVHEAGYLEGFVTQQQIYYYWHNNLKDVCHKRNLTCARVNRFLNNNTETIYKAAEKNMSDPFWYQVHLIYEQIKGIHHGYSEAVKTKNTTTPELTFENILWISLQMDLEEYMNAFAHGSETQFRTYVGHCSAMIKILPGFTDVLFGHATWTSYSSMNRIIKMYDLAVHVHSNSNELIPAMVSTFTSYPGTVNSIDDFYMLSSGLVAMETTNSIYDNKTYQFIKSEGQVPEGIRSLVANRLSTNGSAWINYYIQHNSGTYNNQWMILDMKLFTPGVQPAKGFFSIVETVPGYSTSADLTNLLITSNHFFSYNIPYFEDIRNLSGSTAKMIQYKEYGYEFSYDDNPRARIFKRDYIKVNDVASLLSLLRYNNYKKDNYSICPICKPKENPALAIASRCDLYPVNVTTPKPFSNHSLFGATDAKVSSYFLFRENQMIAESGPTTSGGLLPPFQWTKANTKTPHLGQPDLWNFRPVLISSSKTEHHIRIPNMMNLYIAVNNSTTIIQSSSNVNAPSGFIALLTIAIIGVNLYT